MSENISISIIETPILCLGNETIVNDKTWNFGNSTVLINVSPTQLNMATNKSYVDKLFDIHEKKIDAILDGASISVDNFKQFVDFVNINKMENEQESNIAVNKSYVDNLFEMHEKKMETILSNSFVNIDNFKNFIDFVNFNKMENENLLNMTATKSYVDNLFDTHEKKIDAILDGASVNVDNFKQFVDFVNNSKIENDADLYNYNNNISNNIIYLTSRVTDIENNIKNDIFEIKASIQNQSIRSIDTITSIDNATNNIIKNIHCHTNISSEKEQTSKEILNEIQIKIANETKRAIDAEKNLEEKINALYQYFFKSNSIPIQ